MYFFDESRFGIHSNLGYGWFQKGIITNLKVKIGFQNFYVYSAVNSKNDTDFSLIMPKINTESINLFLSEMSKYLGHSKAIIVMDCASWHKSKNLTVPWSSLEY